MAKAKKVKPASLNGEDLRRILSVGAAVLERNVEAINALNVFPVPDGDTGTNMLLTMRAVEEEAAGVQDEAAHVMAAAMARGALLGARGNSGVILSQFFRGLAQGLSNKHSFDGHDLALAFQEASTAAYKAVSNPVEGTMLTVIRDASIAAQERAATSKNVLEVWKALCEAVNVSVARTPALLAVLREAGVVDAGGQGLAVILEGCLKSLQGEEEALVELTLPILEAEEALGRVREEFLTATEEELYGYCTQFLIQGKDLNADAVRERMETLASSTVVVGDTTMVKVHVHTQDPGPVLSHAVSLGTLSQVSIVNMDEQHHEFVTARRREQKMQPVGILAVASGRGLRDVFLDSGASSVLDGGDTMNPSTREILEAAEGVPAEQVVILPNNPNILPAAEQACALSKRPLKVIPARSIPQGIAALLSFNPQRDLETNLSAMEGATSTVVSGAICAAVRSTVMGDLKVKKGQVIGLLEREVVVAGEDRLAVLRDLVARANPGEGSLVTLYWGADTREAEANWAAEEIRCHFQGVEIEVVFGGQPYYNYLISVE